MVTTGGRVVIDLGSSSSINFRHSGIAEVSSAASSSGAAIGWASNPNSPITIAAVSKSICWLIFAITPLAINCLMMSIGLVSIITARSRIVTTDGISMVFCPFSLILHLRIEQTDRAKREGQKRGVSAASWLIVSCAESNSCRFSHSARLVSSSCILLAPLVRFGPTPLLKLAPVTL
jgi:hypothetical protein